MIQTRPSINLRASLGFVFKWPLSNATREVSSRMLNRVEALQGWTRHHRTEIPKFKNQIQLNGWDNAIPLTQFPQSHMVRSASALASGITTAQKYEKSVRRMNRDILASNPPCLLLLTCNPVKSAFTHTSVTMLLTPAWYLHSVDLRGGFEPETIETSPAGLLAPHHPDSCFASRRPYWWLFLPRMWVGVQ